MVPSEAEVKECSIKQDNKDDIYLLKQEKKNTRRYKLGNKIKIKTTLIIPPELIASFIKEQFINKDIRTIEINRREETTHYTTFDPECNSPIYNEETKEQKFRRKKEMRKFKKPKEEVLEMIYNHFEKKPYWMLRELAEAIKQPEVFIWLHYIVLPKEYSRNYR